MKPNSQPLMTIAAAVILAAPWAGALAAGDQAAIEARYQTDRQACMVRAEAGELRETCLREAGAARQAALDGELTAGANAADLQRNALARCDVHLDAVDRSACERMAQGEGASAGSVEGGGVLKETITVTKPQPEAPGQ